MLPILKTIVSSVVLWWGSYTGITQQNLPQIIPVQPEVKAAMITPTVAPTLAEVRPIPEISAKALWVEDLTNGKLLAERDAYQPLPPASTTKIMTAVIVLDNYDLTEVLTVPAIPNLADTSNIGLVTGEQIKIRDLLYGLLLHSGNDAAIALAMHYPGGLEMFVESMNQKARQLSLEQTHYVNPTGLHNPLHLSSTKDLVNLTKAALQYPDFVQIIGTTEITINSIDGNQKHHLFNRNKLLGTIPGVKGVKTGWTEEAGEALVTWTDRDGKEILMAVLGSEDRFEDTKKLIEWSYASK